MRKIPVLSLFFVALLVAGSANGRVCFLADLECQLGTVTVETAESCPDHLIAEDEQCESIAYKAVCQDSTGTYYEPIGCAEGYVDMDALIPEDGSNRRYRDLYTCASVSECGNCCPEDDLRCPSSYKVCPNNTVISTSALNDTCEEKGVIKSKICDCDKTIYTFTKTDCERLGLTLVGICTEGVSTTMRGTGCECPEGTERVSRTEVRNCPAECECGCTRKGGAIPIPRTTDACVGVATCDACPTASCLTENGEYETQLACESSVANSVCSQNSNSCWVVSGCATNVYQLSKDQDLKDLDTTIPTDRDDTFVCQDDNCSVNYTDKDGTTPTKVEGCEPECVSLGYKYCDSNNNEDGILKHIFCENFPLKYYTGCEAKNMCYKVTLDDQRFYSDGGYCELVLPVADAQYYINNGGYYRVTGCLPLGVPSDNVSERKIRMHACESYDLDCQGGYSPVYGRNTVLPIEGTCLNAEDGRIEECGGKNYTVDCECTHVEGEEGRPSGCMILQLPSNTSQGDFFNNLKRPDGGNQAGNYGLIFTGEIKKGCEDKSKQYGFFKNAGELRTDHTKCFSNDPVYTIENRGDGSFSICGGQQICTGTVLAKEKSSSGVYLSSSSAEFICDGNCVDACNAYASSISLSYYNETDSCTVVKPDSQSSGYGYYSVSTDYGRCQIRYNCGTELSEECLEHIPNYTPIPDGYESCYNPREGADIHQCGISTYVKKEDCCKNPYPYSSGVKLAKSLSDLQLYIGYGFTDVTSEYNTPDDDISEGCYFYKCSDDRKSFGSGYVVCCPQFDGVIVTNDQYTADKEGHINVTADYADQAPSLCFYYKVDNRCSSKQSTGCPVVVDEGTSVDLDQYYKVKTEGGCDYYGACLSDIADCGGRMSPTAIYDETTGERINLVKESQCSNVKEEDKVVGEVCGGPYYTQCFLQTQ